MARSLLIFGLRERLALLHDFFWIGEALLRIHLESPLAEPTNAIAWFCFR